jgi:hypothetical protein
MGSKPGPRPRRPSRVVCESAPHVLEVPSAGPFVSEIPAANSPRASTAPDFGGEDPAAKVYEHMFDYCN